jgi:lipoprotein-anchoring transpeptidase ErfK/SrfK
MLSTLPGESQSPISLHVSVSKQRLDVVEGACVVASYPISTSKFGLGSEPGSYKTPIGRFVIEKKFGEDAPPWAVFKSRQATGEIAAEGGDEDAILSRILWLGGMEPHNANTRERYIYIHGTNQESLIGSPASHGCVRMRNADIVDLYDRVPLGTEVVIHADLD